MWNKEDEACHKGLLSLLNKGSYSLELKELGATETIVSWAAALLSRTCPKCEARKEVIKEEMQEKAEKAFAESKKKRRKKKA